MAGPAEPPTPTVEEYMAVGHDRETAEGYVAADAVCARNAARLASMSPEQREAGDRFCREVVAEFARRTAPKRAQVRPGEAVDFSGEWAAAQRHAIRNDAPATVPASDGSGGSGKGPLRGPRSRGAGRPAGRPGGKRTAASSRDGPSSDDSSGDPEPGPDEGSGQQLLLADSPHGTAGDDLFAAIRKAVQR
jgi:hypothetical protein